MKGGAWVWEGLGRDVGLRVVIRCRDNGGRERIQGLGREGIISGKIQRPRCGEAPGFL